MSINIKINAGDDRPFVAEIEQLPTQIALERPETSLTLLPFGFIALIFAFTFLKEISWVLALAVLLGCGGFLVFYLKRVLACRGRKNIMSFEKKRVVVTEVGALRDKHWQADYAEFEGVYLRRRIAKAGQSNSTYQIIELKHADSAKTLPLFVDLNHKAPTKRWQSYGELFNLPQIKKDD